LFFPWKQQQLFLHLQKLFGKSLLIHNAGHNEASPLQQSVAVTVLYSLTQKIMSGSPLGLWLPFEIMDFVPGKNGHGVL
jgi:hypothetical protein